MASDPTPTDAQVDVVIAGLTKGERKILLATFEGEAKFYHEVAATPRVSLFRKRLLDWHDDGPRFRLTPLGLATRARLQKDDTDVG